MGEERYGEKLFAAAGLDFNHMVLGKEGAGTILKVGSDVWNWKVGDDVMFTPEAMKSPGTFAEYCSVPQYNLAKKPVRLSFEQCASLPFSFLTAWKCIEGIESTQSVCLIGAGGSVGWLALNVLQSLRQCSVTAVCGPRNFDRVSSRTNESYLYTSSEDMSQLFQKKFDVVIDLSAFQSGDEAQLVSLVSKGGKFRTARGSLVSSVDSQPSLLCGLGSGVSALASKKAKYWR